MGNLSGETVIRNELRACCSEEVDRMLFNFVGAALKTATEVQLLNHIKSIAVVGVHKEVHRQKFNKMVQAEGQGIVQFVAKLKAQSTLCAFVVRCKSNGCDEEVSFAEEMISTQMISGLRNHDHQSRILAEADKLSGFQEKFERLANLEKTDNSTSHLGGRQIGQTFGANATKSDYKKKQADWKQGNKDCNDSKKTRCPWCGYPDHRGKPMDRANCSAKNIVCRKCKTKGHYPRVCNAKDDRSNVSTAEANEHSEEEENSTAYSAEVATVF